MTWRVLDCLSLSTIPYPTSLIIRPPAVLESARQQQSFLMARDWQNLLRRQGPAPLPPTPEEISFNNSPQILAITGTCFAVAALVVSLRCYVRISMLKIFGIDDWIMLLAMVCEHQNIGPLFSELTHTQDFLHNYICLLQVTRRLWPRPPHDSHLHASSFEICEAHEDTICTSYHYDG